MTDKLTPEQEAQVDELIALASEHLADSNIIGRLMARAATHHILLDIQEDMEGQEEDGDNC